LALCQSRLRLSAVLVALDEAEAAAPASVAQAMRWPLETGETALIVAGLLLALATFLLLYMVGPRVGGALVQSDEGEILDEPRNAKCP
jgi:hypothetical protein